jgi:hypothetical protein
MTDQVSHARDRLRKAVARDSFAETEAFAAEYSRAVTETAGKLPRGDVRALEAVRQAVDVLTWAERAVRASRGHTTNQLARISASRAYRSVAGPREPSYRLEG